MPFIDGSAVTGDGVQLQAANDAPDPSFIDSLSASFKQENIIGSYFSSERARMRTDDFFKKDATFDPFSAENIKGYEQDAVDGAFDDVFNAKAAAAVKADIDRERKNRQIREASGATGFLTDMLATIVDPTILIPGGGLVKAGRVGYSAGKSALAVGVAAGVGAAVQEVGLQATQSTRTKTESAMNVGGSVILGGLLGAGASRLFSNAEWSKVSNALTTELSEEVVNPGEIAQTIVKRMQSAGAAAVDDIDISDLGVGGPKIAKAVARATDFVKVNPGIQTLFSPSAKVREAYVKMVDNPVYLSMEMEGRTLGPSVENLMKEFQRGKLADWLEGHNKLYREARSNGFTGNVREFNEAVAYAGRRGDIDPNGNQYITRAAQDARAKIFDPLLERAKATGQLPEDVKTTTAASYVTRLWNRTKLIAQEDRFREIAGKYFKGKLGELQPSELSRIKPEGETAYQSALKAQADEDAIMIEAMKTVRSVKADKRPVIRLLKELGGVRQDSTLARELDAMGVNPRTSPGLFKRNGGLGAVDNIVVSEHEILNDNIAARANGYADPNEIMDAIRREMAGDPLLTAHERALADDARILDENISEWMDRRKIDPMKSWREVADDLKARIPEGEARTLQDLLYEQASMIEAMKAQARQKGKVPDFVSQADLDDYVNEAVTAVFNKLTGRGFDEVPEWIVPVQRGPLKERTFNIPDELIEDFLENDIEMVLRRHVRTMGAEVELAERFGRADMRDQIADINKEYDALSEAATTEKERAKLDVSRKRDLKNIQAFRDMLRGTYRPDDPGSVWSKATRAALTWNYVRLLGGVALSSLTDATRQVAVHGLRATMMEGYPALVSGLRAAKISKADAKALGAVTETILHSRLATLADLTDPYAHGSKFERFLANSSTVFSKWTGLGYWNDAMKTVSSVLTQNRMAKNAMAGLGSLDKYEKAYMAYLGIDEGMAARIVDQIKTHGVKERNIWGANVLEWTDADAKRVWAAALNKDVDRTIVTKGVSDTPLVAHHNIGRIILQFKSFALASHQRVLIAGLQERPHRFMEAMVGATALGMLISYVKMIERDDWDRANSLLENPGQWIADGLDRTGILALPFEVSNTFDKASAAFGGAPVGITALASKLAGDPSSAGGVTRYASRNVAGLLGPSLGLFQDLAQIATIPLRDAKEGDANAIIRQIPGGTLPGVRSALHYGIKPALHDMVN